MSNARHADLTQIRRHWRSLCDTIGERVSGSEDEQRAADYVERQFKRFGLTELKQQSFEFPNYKPSRCALWIQSGRSRKRVDNVEPFMFSVNTPAGAVRGPIEYLEGGHEFKFRRNLRGKIGLIIGGMSLMDRPLTQRLIDSGMAGLIAVDARVPFEWRTAIGAAPHWVEGYDLPTVGIPYRQATELLGQLPLKAELDIQGCVYPAMSQNVMAQVTGTTRPDQIIVVSGHHDAVAGTVGADDNASGVVFALELARLFARRRPKRTIRFISFGVEEKLSIGAYVYMRSFNKKLRQQHVLTINADAIASRAGEDMLWVTGPRSLLRITERHYDKRDHPAKIIHGVNGFSDQFPLNIGGVPSIRLARPNMFGNTLGGYWSLHGKHDNLANVDPKVMARTVDTIAAIISEIANTERLPFARKIPVDQMKTVKHTAKHVYHHPYFPSRFDYSFYEK